jgi:hypothetical protein
VSIQITIHSKGKDKDALTGKTAEGATITINGKKRFLSQKSFWQIIDMELGGGNAVDEEPEAPLFNDRMRSMAGNHDEE